MAESRRPTDLSASATELAASAGGGAETPADRSGVTATGEGEPRSGAAQVGLALTSLDVGEELGGYRVLRELGRGGMGAVFEAEDPKLRRRVALKVMLPGLAHHDTAKERFLREARSAAAVEHEHVVPIYQVGEDRGVPYLVMRLLPGESLESKLSREGRLAPGAVAELGRQAALGLAAAHERGVTHRDVKPGNLWVEPDGRLRVLDFGLARSLDAEEALTNSGCAVGTPEYMAPEQVRGKKAGPKADLFALGVVLYRAATGVSPFRRESNYGSMRAVDRETPADPRLHVPDLPDPLAEAILALLSKRLAERPPSAAAVAEVFEGVARAVKDPSSWSGLKAAFHSPAQSGPSSLPAGPSLPSGFGLAAGPSLPVGPSLPPMARSGTKRRATTPAPSVSPAKARPSRSRRRWVVAAAAAAAVAVLVAIVDFAIVPLGSSDGSRGGADTKVEDPLPAGSRWVGTFAFEPDGELRGQAALSVARRDNATFTGVYSSEEDLYVWRVQGTVQDGKVTAEFVEAVKDNREGDVVGRTTLDGTVAGDRMELMWRQGDELARIELRRGR